MIVIREAKEEDLPQILTIYNEIIANSTAIYYYKPQTLKMRLKWFTKTKKMGYPIFVACQDYEILGTSSLAQFRVHDGYKFTAENTIHIAAAARGRGIGKLLMPPLIEAAKKMNLHSIVAAIDAENKASIALHKQFQFEIVGNFKEVGYKFNTWLNLIFMQHLILPNHA